MTRVPSFDIDLGWNASGDGNVFPIGQVVDISGPSSTRDDVEVADRTVSANYRQNWGAYSGGDELTIGVNWDPVADGTHGTAAGTALVNDFERLKMSALPHWRMRINLPTGTAVWTFDGVLSSYAVTSPENEVNTLEITTQLSSKPTLSVGTTNGYLDVRWNQSTDSWSRVWSST